MFQRWKKNLIKHTFLQIKYKNGQTTYVKKYILVPLVAIEKHCGEIIQ